MALTMAIILGTVSFLRAYWVHKELLKSFTVSLTLGIIVAVSVMLGTCVPIIFKKLKIDPAFAAGPFLATAMDILGILIYCYIGKLILG